jgi:UDP-N-acetylglucosamine--N-acetylmuramyl-(pentapeptide) pyrophosphoryl-undecaprenol N-acetylglucosamine transferase
MALVEKEAAILIPDVELENKLVPELNRLVADEKRQDVMKKNIRQFARPDATEKIVDEVLKLLER